MTFSGRLVYFPNIIVSMVKSAVSPQKPSNVVTFRVPTYMNKFDIKEYFEKIYGVGIKNVRVHNFIGRKKLNGRVTQSKKNADIVLNEDFKYLNIN